MSKFYRKILFFAIPGPLRDVKGGYLDFSHLTELKNMYISLKFI